MRPTVQVIIATRDRPQMLRVALHSILASAAMVPERVEVLVVDDASEARTETWNVCNNLFVDYVRNDENMGVGATLARGYDLTDSEFTVFLGDDDALLPRFFDVHLSKVREGHDAAYSSYYLADHSLRITREVRLPLVTHRDLLQGRCNATDMAMMRRSTVEDIGGWRPEFERAMLLCHWLRMTHEGRDIATIREPTWLYRRHALQLSHTRPNEHDQALRDAAIAQYRVAA